mmetsp:Transcript_116723/g.326504  ORF Transcript_116723/g.326504 Transcript_116723/m.326504 type:complete len:255 (+) Transcript_116723:35-799(+)
MCALGRAPPKAPCPGRVRLRGRAARHLSSRGLGRRNILGRIAHVEEDKLAAAFEGAVAHPHGIFDDPRGGEVPEAHAVRLPAGLLPGGDDLLEPKARKPEGHPSLRIAHRLRCPHTDVAEVAVVDRRQHTEDERLLLAGFDALQVRAGLVEPRPLHKEPAGLLSCRGVELYPHAPRGPPPSPSRRSHPGPHRPHKSHDLRRRWVRSRFPEQRALHHAILCATSVLSGRAADENGGVSFRGRAAFRHVCCHLPHG